MIKTSIVVAPGSAEFREIITSLLRFESSVSELPANAKRAKELHPEASGEKVLAACDIRQKLRNIYVALKAIEFDMAVSKEHIPYTITRL